MPRFRIYLTGNATRIVETEADTAEIAEELAWEELGDIIREDLPEYWNVDFSEDAK